MTTREELDLQLAALGIQPGDAVLVHASLRGLGAINDGANGVIDALLATVGEEGTVIFPTLTGSESDGPDCPPIMRMAKKTCASWVGMLPRIALHRTGGMRFLHPTHSVYAIGADATIYTRGHEQSHSPCDDASPYRTLMRRDGKILLLGGVTLESCTAIHCAEELAGVPYHLQEQVTEGIVVRDDGSEIEISNRLHRWTMPAPYHGCEKRFENARDPLAAAGAIQTGPTGGGTSDLIDAALFGEVMIPLLRDQPLSLLVEPT